MINKISAIFGIKQNKQQAPQYKTPNDVPREKHCENCAYQGLAKCTGINCFTGIMEKLEGENDTV